MKYLLKDVDFKNLKYSRKELIGSSIVNCTYLDEILEFQSPKVIIDSVTDTELVISVKNKLFISRIHELENELTSHFKKEVITIFNHNNSFKVKLDKSLKIYFNDQLFNKYDLKEGNVIILLLTFSKIWITDKVYINLHSSEIMLLKK